jgi:hypothetical protein
VLNLPFSVSGIRMKTLENDTFNFFLPVEAVSIEKSQKPDDKRWIQGIASTDNLDLQGEKVVQSGIDLAYFTEHGYVNDDHKPGPENKVGEPTEARITKAGLWVKAFLYKGHQRAEYWWEFINALVQSDAKRKVGFSIQGKVVRREGNSILKCWLQDIAITASPVNTHTWAEIVKSLSGERWCVHPWRSVEKSCKGCPGKGACGQKPVDEAEEKALSAGGMGRAMIPQSLEGGVKSQLHKSTISYEESIKMLQIEKGYSRTTAKAIADSIFATEGLI